MSHTAEQVRVAAQTHRAATPDSAVNITAQMLDAYAALLEVKPVGWARTRHITDDEGYPIGYDDPEISFGKESPGDLTEGWYPIYAAPQAATIPDGWKWMTHPDWNGGKPIPVLVFEADGMKYYQPFDCTGLEFEWDERSSDWQELPKQPATVPSGYKLVPHQATHEMCEAVHFGANCAEHPMTDSDREFWEACYSDLLAAAPEVKP